MKAIIQIFILISVILISQNILNAQGIIIQAGARMTVQDGAKLNTTGTAGITVKSDASGTGSFLDQNSGTGNVTFSGSGSETVERYLTKDAWHLISAPISDALSGIFISQYLRPYDEANNEWDDYIVPLDIPLPAGVGFVCWPVTSQAYIFTGSINTNTVTHDLDYSGPTRGNNLIGNPYPSAIDWNASGGWTKDNVGGTIWIWNQSGDPPGAGNYGTWNGEESTNGVTRYIPVGQGFFVKALADGATLSMTNAVRVHSDKTFFKNSGLPNSLRLHIKNYYGSDEIVVYFKSNSSWAYDPHIDSQKMFGDAYAPQLFSFKPGDPHELSINVLPEIKNPLIVPVWLNVGVNGEYTITASQMESFAPNVLLSLEDLKLGKVQDLRDNPVYTFVARTSDTAHRFNLNFSNFPYGIPGTVSGNAIRIYSNGQTIYVKTDTSVSGDATMLVYDAIGRLLYKRSFNAVSLNKFNMNLSHGYYIIKVLANSGVYTQKVFID